MWNGNGRLMRSNDGGPAGHDLSSLTHDYCWASTPAEHNFTRMDDLIGELLDYEDIMRSVLARVLLWGEQNIIN
jgi:hypothetical protein